VPDFPRASELFRIFRDEAVAKSSRLTVNAADRDGSDANILGYGVAVVGEEVIAQLASTEEGFWLASAFREKLDKWAWDRYQMLRKQAAPSFVFAQFTTTAPAPAAFTIPGGTRAATSSGQEFVAVQGVAFPFGGVGPVQVLMRSTLAGIDQNVRPLAIRSVTSQVPGAPTDLAVTNAEAAAGGDDIEQDDAFKNRIMRFWVAARRGTRGAIETGALEVPGVNRAVAIESLTGAGYPARTVTLVIADQFTNALVKQGVAVPAYETQSQALAQVVASELNEYRACGIPVKVIVAQTRLISVVLRLRFQATVTNPDAVALAARTIVAQSINTLNGGATYDPATSQVLLRSVSGLDVMGDEVASPVGPIVPTSPYQILRTSLALVTTDSQATLQSQATNV
jgi:hypothetical protein